MNRSCRDRMNTPFSAELGNSPNMRENPPLDGEPNGPLKMSLISIVTSSISKGSSRFKAFF